jgi:hypothetical protein
VCIQFFLWCSLFQKILKSKWHPHDADRVLKHDLAVQNNWELLQSGKLEVDPELKEHLAQFTQRKVPASHRPGNNCFLQGIVHMETSWPVILKPVKTSHHVM